MTEKYWQRYKKQLELDVWYSNKLWIAVREDMERKSEGKHPLELYNICKSDNPFIRQIRNSPNITTKTVSELICRDLACDLQYCVSLHKLTTDSKRGKRMQLEQCQAQYKLMTQCLVKEQQRLDQKERMLRRMVRERTLDVPAEEVGVEIPAPEKAPLEA